MSLGRIQEGPTWCTVGRANEVKQLEISYPGSMHSGLKPEYSQVHFPMDCVACIGGTTTGPVSPNRNYLNGGHVGRPLKC